MNAALSLVNAFLVVLFHFNLFGPLFQEASENGGNRTKPPNKPLIKNGCGPLCHDSHLGFVNAYSLLAYDIPQEGDF